MSGAAAVVHELRVGDFLVRSCEALVGGLSVEIFVECKRLALLDAHVARALGIAIQAVAVCADQDGER